MDAFFHALAKELDGGHDWNDLGLFLELPDSELEEFKSEPDLVKRSFQVLQKWARGLRAPYVEHLLYALEDLKDVGVIEEVVIENVLKRAYPEVGEKMKPPQWDFRSATPKVRANTL